MKKVIFISIVMSLLCYGCKNGELEGGTKGELEKLEGTKWKLAGIVDTKTGVLTVLEPKDCDRCYTLTFDTDNSFSGNTVSNELLGTYNSSTRSIQILGRTKAAEMFDGDLFFYTLDSTLSFHRQKDELKFYYNDSKKYLIFKLQEP